MAATTSTSNRNGDEGGPHPGGTATSEKPSDKDEHQAAPANPSRQCLHWLSTPDGDVSQRVPEDRGGKPGKSVTKMLGGDTKSFHISSQHADTSQAWLTVMVTSPAFETLFIVLIMLNAVAMAVEVQYDGLLMGFDLGYPSSDASASFAKSMEGVQMAFGILFTLEVILKIAGLGIHFLQSCWNIVDSIIVLLWLFSTFANRSLFLDPSVLRLLRLARVIRLFRLASKMDSISSLQLIVSCITSSVQILFFSACVLLLVMTMFSLSLNFLLQDFLMDDGVDQDSRRLVYGYFGTFSRAILTMCEITIANWVPPTRLLVEEVGEWYGHLIIFYVFCVSFGVVKVITGVFLQETFSVAGSDDELMIVRAQQNLKKHTRKVKMLFDECDSSHNNRISLSEFKDFMLDDRVLAWLRAMELSVDNVTTLFNLIDTGGDHQVSVEELVQGISKLKGSARGVDMAVLMQQTRHITERVDAGNIGEELMQLRAETRALQKGMADARSPPGGSNYEVFGAPREIPRGVAASPSPSIRSRGSLGRSSVGSSPSMPPAPRPMGDQPVETTRKFSAWRGGTSLPEAPSEADSRELGVIPGPIIQSHELTAALQTIT